MLLTVDVGNTNTVLGVFRERCSETSSTKFDIVDHFFSRRYCAAPCDARMNPRCLRTMTGATPSGITKRVRRGARRAGPPRGPAIAGAVTDARQGRVGAG